MGGQKVGSNPAIKLVEPTISYAGQGSDLFSKTKVLFTAFIEELPNRLSQEMTNIRWNE